MGSETGSDEGMMESLQQQVRTNSEALKGLAGIPAILNHLQVSIALIQHGGNKNDGNCDSVATPKKISNDEILSILINGSVETNVIGEKDNY